MRKASRGIVFLSLLAGAFLAGSWHRQRTADHGTPSGHRVLYYRDPMHPEYRSAQPGMAPDCGMPVYANGAQAAREDGPDLPPGTVQISLEKQQMIGVRLGRVERKPATQIIRVLGRVALDEARVYPVTSKTDDWVRLIFPNCTVPNCTGCLVEKAQPLVAVHSKEVLAAQQGYLFALGTLERLRQSSGPELVQRARLALTEACASLESLGFAFGPKTQIGGPDKLGPGKVARRGWRGRPFMRPRAARLGAGVMV